MVLGHFNLSCKKKDRVDIERYMPENELEAWLTDEKLAYVAEAMEKDPKLRFTLVATPNILASPADIMATAKAFGNGHPREMYVDKVLYDRYSAEELSGTPGDTGRFALV